jgi:hypothetical protein
MNANPLATVGLMLTLAGLVGSFFNIQLSQWLRDLIALAQKVPFYLPMSLADRESQIACEIPNRSETTGVAGW